jgi:hypothetical protein
MSINREPDLPRRVVAFWLPAEGRLQMGFTITVTGREKSEAIAGLWFLILGRGRIRLVPHKTRQITLPRPELKTPGHN